MKGIIVAVFVVVTINAALALPQNFGAFGPTTQRTPSQTSTTASPTSTTALDSFAFNLSNETSSINQSTTTNTTILDYYYSDFVPQNYETACQDQRDVEERNKQMVLTAYQEVFGNHNFDAVDTYFHMDYIQHNPNVTSGRQGLKDFAKMYTEGLEKKPVDIRMVSAEWDLVWIHLMSRNRQGEDLAIVDIFRVEDGLIKEHWDVIQHVKDSSSSKNAQLF